MKKVIFIFGLLVLTLTACSKEELDPALEGANLNQETTETNRGVLHHVSFGSGDVCEAFGQDPGCDGNYSIVANMFSDGTVSGQWQDTFFGGGNGIHVAVDCLTVDGNTAVVGGYVTHGSADGMDFTGYYAVTALWDNGTSNNDPKDAVSYSFIGMPEGNCSYSPSIFPQLEVTRGQVKIW